MCLRNSSKNTKILKPCIFVRKEGLVERTSVESIFINHTQFGKLAFSSIEFLKAWIKLHFLRKLGILVSCLSFQDLSERDTKLVAHELAVWGALSAP